MDAWPAVELFCQRAVAVRHDFELTHENAWVIANICARLDGLPLAIELAAAQSKFFSPQVLLERLTQTIGGPALQLLKTNIRNAPGRHRSLWDTIAWSYALLDANEQRFFRRLAVFVSDCTPEAAAAVGCDAEDWALDPLNGLAALVDKNLLQVAQLDPSLRFTMLETVREFGLAQLADAQELVATQERHACYFAQLVAVQSPRLLSAESTHAITQIQSVYPNVRVAFRHLLAQRDIDACLQLADHLSLFWVMTESFKEAETYLQDTLSLAADRPPKADYVNLLASAGFTAFMRGQPDRAKTYFEQCLTMNAAICNLGNSRKIGAAHGLLAWICFDQGDCSAASGHFAAAQANDRAAGNEWALATTLTNWGQMAARLGEFGQANTLLQEALLCHRRIGQAWGIVRTLTNQGLLYIFQRQFSEAARVLAESQAICTEKMLAGPNYELGLMAAENGECARAGSLLKEALLHEQKKGAPRYLLPVIEAIMRLAVQQTHYSTALILAGAICAQRRRLKLVMPPVEKQLFDEAVAIAHHQLSKEANDVAWRKGEAMTLEEAEAFALSVTTV